MGDPPGDPRGGVVFVEWWVLYQDLGWAWYREAGITWFRMSRNYMVSEKWSSWEVVVFPSDHF